MSEQFSKRFNPQMKLAVNPRFAKFLAGEKVYPINIELSPSNVCDAMCDWCFYKGTHTKPSQGAYMEDSMLENLIREMKDLDIRALTWTGGGEPTLHPKHAEMVDLAYELGIKQGMFTNALSKRGIRYDPSKFEWIRVSNTDKDWNIENMQEIRANVKIMGMGVNYDGDDEVVKRAEQVGELIGVDYVQIRQALNLRGVITDRLPPKFESSKTFLTTYKFDDSANPHGYSNCYGFNFVPFIWNNGDVDVCGYMKKVPGYTLGNLAEKSLKQIVDEAPRSVPVRDICQVCCKNHEINKATNSALNLEDKDFV